MKLTNEQLTQIIREELEQVLEGPKYSIADKEKKIAKRATRAEINMDDLIYKGDDYDIDDTFIDNEESEDKPSFETKKDFVKYLQNELMEEMTKEAFDDGYEYGTNNALNMINDFKSYTPENAASAYISLYNLYLNKYGKDSEELNKFVELSRNKGVIEPGKDSKFNNFLMILENKREEE